MNRTINVSQYTINGYHGTRPLSFRKIDYSMRVKRVNEEGRVVSWDNAAKIEQLRYENIILSFELRLEYE